jgi:HEAT repeat protein
MLPHLLLPALLCLGGLVPAAPQKTPEGKRSVADLVADLKKGEADRERAFRELEALGTKAEAAVPALAELLSSKDEYARLNATLVLGKIGRPSVAPLSKALASGDEEVRFYGAWGLGLVGPAAKGAAPDLVRALADKSAQVRRKAAYALGRVDPEPDAAAAALVGALEDADADVRTAAAAALVPLGKAAVPALVKALQGDKQALRPVAMKTLGEIGAAAERAIPDLKALLWKGEKDAEPAADALAGIGAAAIPDLTAAAAHDSDAVRGLALRSLQKIGAPAVPTIVDLLGAKYTDVRRQAATVLGVMLVRDKSVVIGLGYALKDKDVQVRRNALQSIRNLGTSAQLAEPYVSSLLVDLDPQLRLEAFQTLQGLGVDPRPGLKKALSHTDPAIRIPTASLMAALNVEVDLAEPVLLAGLKEKNEALKMQAAHSLSLRGLQADVVLPIFISGLKNELPSVRQQAAESIARYGPKARQAEPVLTAALDDADDGVRIRALTALRAVAEPKGLLPVMLKVLKGKDANLHGPAAQVVYQIGPEAVGALATALREEKAPALRMVCLQTLAMVGPPAKAAVPELIRALSDPVTRARLNAARALGNIGSDAKEALAALEKAELDQDTNVQQIAKAAKAQISAGANQKGFQVQGVLTADDPFDKVRQQHHHVVYTYYMKKGQTYTINLTSPWDNYLRLESPQGKELAQDDDSGGNLNARIVYAAAEDGWHRIIVTSYAARATGSYTLRVD